MIQWLSLANRIQKYVLGTEHNGAVERTLQFLRYI